MKQMPSGQKESLRIVLCGEDQGQGLQKEKRWEVSDKSWPFCANHYTRLLLGHNSNPVRQLAKRTQRLATRLQPLKVFPHLNSILGMFCQCVG